MPRLRTIQLQLDAHLRPVWPVLSTPQESTSTAAAEREVQLSRPEPVNYSAEEARAVRAAFAHTRPPLVTPLLMAANALTFMAVVLNGGAIMSPAPEVLRGLGATYGPAVTAGEWWRLALRRSFTAG